MRRKLITGHAVRTLGLSKETAVRIAEARRDKLTFNPKTDELLKFLEHPQIKGKINEGYEHLVNFYKKELELRAERIDNDTKYVRIASQCFVQQTLRELQHL